MSCPTGRDRTRRHQHDRADVEDPRRRARGHTHRSGEARLTAGSQTTPARVGDDRTAGPFRVRSLAVVRDASVRRESQRASGPQTSRRHLRLGSYSEHSDEGRGILAQSLPAIMAASREPRRTAADYCRCRRTRDRRRLTAAAVMACLICESIESLRGLTRIAGSRVVGWTSKFYF